MWLGPSFRLREEDTERPQFLVTWSIFKTLEGCFQRRRKWSPSTSWTPAWGLPRIDWFMDWCVHACMHTYIYPYTHTGRYSISRAKLRLLIAERITLLVRCCSLLFLVLRLLNVLRILRTKKYIIIDFDYQSPLTGLTFYFKIMKIKFYLFWT